MRSFENRRVLVTGSGRGIGRAIAHRFAGGSAKVLLVARILKEETLSPSELSAWLPEAPPPENSS